MSRYIYDEIKNEFLKDGVEVDPMAIIDCMARISKNMGYTTPGEIPEELLETFKHKTMLLLRRYVKVLSAIESWLAKM